MNTTLIAVTGPSELGQGPVIDQAVTRYPEIVRVISYTDRPLRTEEVDGKDFYFVSEDRFTQMIEEGLFAEWQRLLGNGYRYGKTKEDLEKTCKENQGKVILTRVSVVNLPVFKRLYPLTRSIFIDVKDTISLIEKLKEMHGGDDSSLEYDRKFKFATEERRRRHLVDFIMNMKDDKEATLQEFIRLIEECKKL